MSTAVAVPSAQEMLNRVAFVGSAFTVYQAPDEWLCAEVFGNAYWIPPDLGGISVPHPALRGPDRKPVMVKADGCLVIKDHTHPNGIVIHSARDIAEVLCRHYAERGVVLLSGAPDDHEFVRVAKDQYRLSRRAQARQVLDAWGEKVGNFMKNPANAGKNPPMMPEHVQRAQEFFDDLGADAVKKYTCPLDGYATDEGVRFQRHMQVNHPNLSSDLPAEPKRAQPIKPDDEKGRK